MSEEKKREDVVHDQTGTPTGAQPEHHHETELSATHPVFNSKSGEGHKGHNKEYTGGNRFWQKWNTTEKFTFWLMVFTAVYAVMTIFQWSVIRESNRINREALTSVQRAYVGLKTIQAHYVPYAQGNMTFWDFRGEWENSGTTPTRTLRSRFNHAWRDEPFPDDYTFPDIESSRSQDSISFIAARAILLTGSMPVPPDELRKVQEGKQHLYFWGWTVYRDVFENSELHLTEFCREVTAIYGDVLKGEGARIIYTHCPSRNCVDKDCADYAEAEKKLKGK